MGVPVAYGLTIFFVAMARDNFPHSTVPLIAGLAALVLCIFSGLKALHIVHAGAGRMRKIIFAIGYAGVMYLFCMIVGVFAMFAYGGCGGCS
jgi:hypothetical protein